MDKELLDLESNLIGSIILSNKKFLLSQEEGLLPEHFENKAYEKAYEVMLKHQRSDMVTVMHNMKNKSMVEEVRQAAGYCISAGGFASWMKMMNLKTSKNKLKNLAKKIPLIVDEDITIEEMIDKVNDLLINNSITKNSGAPKNVIDVINTVEQELKETNFKSLKSDNISQRFMMRFDQFLLRIFSFLKRKGILSDQIVTKIINIFIKSKR